MSNPRGFSNTIGELAAFQTRSEMSTRHFATGPAESYSCQVVSAQRIDPTDAELWGVDAAPRPCRRIVKNTPLLSNRRFVTPPWWTHDPLGDWTIH